MGAKFEGILPAIASPCDEGERFLEEPFAALAERLYRAGVHGLYVCGGTGDGYRMRLDERKRAAEIASEISAEFGGLAIIHVGALNTRDAAELAEHAAQVGASAVASLPPVNASQPQLVQYYAELARAAQLPLFVYHIPAVTHLTPTVDEMVELLDIDGVAGMKCTDWNLFFMKQVLRARPDAVVFSGYDELLCPGLLYGAHGGVGTWYNVFPKLFLGIFEGVRSGDVARAMELQEASLAFSDVAWQGGVFQAFEAVMRERGLAPRCFRRPHQTLDDAARREVLGRLDGPTARIGELTGEG